MSKKVRSLAVIMALILTLSGCTVMTPDIDESSCGEAYPETEKNDYIGDVFDEGDDFARLNEYIKNNSTDKAYFYGVSRDRLTHGSPMYLAVDNGTRDRLCDCSDCGVRKDQPSIRYCKYSDKGIFVSGGIVYGCAPSPEEDETGFRFYKFETLDGENEYITRESYLYIDKIDKYPDNELLIMTTGSQGEPMSALTRMASGTFKQIKLRV